MKNKIWGLVGIAALSAALAGLVIAQTSAWLDLDGLRWIRSGTTYFRSFVNSSNQWALQQIDSLGGAEVLTVDDATGSLLLRTRTSAQIQALAPSASGHMLINITVPALCISSGTGTGAWILPYSTGAVSGIGNTRNACY